MRFRISKLWIAIGGTLLVVLSGLWWWLYRESHPNVEDATSLVQSVRTDVELSEAKLTAAGLELASVQCRMWRPTRMVPGRVGYDETRHVDVKSSAPGILVEVRVKPGDNVTAGQVLGVLNSPEVGHARADQLQREAEVAQAQRRSDWVQTTRDGLLQLLQAIAAREDAQDIAARLKDTSLGARRSEVVSAYSRYRLAQSLAQQATSAAGSGAIAGRTLDERIGERDSAEASLQGLTEELSFMAREDANAAQLAVTDAERRLQISRHHVQTLQGYNAPQPDENNVLSLVEIRAPFAGTVQARSYAATERIEPGDSLFVLADTTRLCVVADIRDREWPALQLAPGERIEFTCPALPERQLQATVYYVGQEVIQETNAVPLVATISNPDASLKPGQFVWVRVPLAPPVEHLAVPESAVVEHEGRSFVFLAQGERTFRRRDVVVTAADAGWMEVTAGLQAGDKVVVRGAFYLKSELLLEAVE